MLSTNTEQYAELLIDGYEKKVPMYVYGPPGIGKTEIPRQVFPSIAKKKNRKFVEWTDLDMEQKLACIKEPGKYWVFCDQRVGQMDSTDLRGIPNMVNKEMLETIPMSWIVYFTQEQADGVIFFDELNLAAPVVAGQAYQIINEHTIADRRLGKEVYVFGAGNRAGLDQAYVYEMPFPLKDRFAEFEIEPDVKSWTEWAFGKINSHLISFIQWKSSYLFKVDESKSCKSSTPRGIARASKLIEGLDIVSNKAHTLISISVGEAFATEFQAYVKNYKKLNWKKLFKDPKSVEGFQLDELWAVIGGLAENYSKMNTPTKENQKKFADIMSIIKYMEADFALVSMRLIKENDLDKFRKFIAEYDDKSVNELMARFGKFVF